MGTDLMAWNVVAAALGVGMLHTALGPDHTLPFLAFARARRWSLRRTLAVTAACGVAHVVSSLLLGLVGLGAGVAVGHLELAEAGRGRMAAWLLVAFGLAYGLWGVRHAWRARHGVTLHTHGGHPHVHAHGAAPHGHTEPPPDTTVWVLFTVFVLGPCEPLIPLFVLPASQGRWGLAATTAVVFGVVTVATMLVLVGLAYRGLQRVSFGRLERWSHALAGAVLLASGLAVLYLGL